MTRLNLILKNYNYDKTFYFFIDLRSISKLFMQLEEPPFFRTDFMGSNIHAKYLHDNKIKTKGMICLEMIGYFNDSENSQDYPVGFLSWFYGKKGDYVTVVQKY